MVLVDTSVLISYFRGHTNEKVRLFQEILERNIPFGISAYTYQELLQGAKDETEFALLKDYLASQTIYDLEADASTYERAARLYFNLRRKGVIPRSSIDMLIALTALEYKLAILHDDRDFAIMAREIPEIRDFSSL